MSFCGLSLKGQTQFHTLTKQGKLTGWNILIFTFLKVADGKTKFSEMHCSKHSENSVCSQFLHFRRNSHGFV
jgi:hypothetical protein